MANKKKDFTSADGAINKFFSAQKETQHTSDTQHTQYTNNEYITQHINNRSKRNERFGLLLNKQLKEDLSHLSKATGSKSLNDFIINILLEYINKTENQTKIKQYKKLLEE
jgi:hypothetical protein